MLLQSGHWTLNGFLGSTIQPGLLFGSPIGFLHSGQLGSAAMPQSRGTAAEGISSAKDRSSHVTHSSAKRIHESATALADEYFATLARACATAWSVNSVRLSLRGHCGWRTTDGTVVGRVAGGGAAPATSSAAMRTSMVSRVMVSSYRETSF